MIKLKDILLSETASTRAMRDSKEGASKQFVRDFKKAFAKSSKENGYNRYFDYSYLKSHVSSDLQTAQIVSDIRKGDEVEPAYYLAKEYYNSFAQSRNSNVFDQVVNKVDAWLKDNKIETR